MMQTTTKNVGNSIPFDITENILSYIDCPKSLRALRLISSVWNYSVERRLLRDIRLKGQTCDSVYEGLEHKFKEDNELAGFVRSLSILWEDEDLPVSRTAPRYTIRLMSICTNIVNLDITDLFEFLLTEDAIPALRNLKSLTHFRVRRTRVYKRLSTFTLPQLIDLMQYWPNIISIDLSTCRLRTVNQDVREHRSYNLGKLSTRTPVRRCFYLKELALHISPTLTYGDVVGLEMVAPRLETFSLTTDFPFPSYKKADLALSACIEAWIRTLTNVTVKALEYSEHEKYEDLPYTELTYFRKAIIALKRVNTLSIDRSVLLPKDFPDYPTLTRVEYLANGSEHSAFASRISKESGFLPNLESILVDFIEEDLDVQLPELDVIEELYGKTSGKYIKINSKEAKRGTRAYKHCVTEVQ